MNQYKEKYLKFTLQKFGVLTRNESKVRRNNVWRNGFGGMGSWLVIQYEFSKIIHRIDNGSIAPPNRPIANFHMLI